MHRLPGFAWFTATALSLLGTGCATQAPLPVDRQSIDSTYQYTIPREDNDGWSAASLEAGGIRQQPLAAMVSRIRDNTFPRVHSVLLVKDSKLVFEEYFAGYHRFRAHPMHSVSKSVTSILLGIANDQGLVAAGDPVHRFFADYPDLEWIDRPYGTTVRHLLTMTHGTDWDERSRSLNDAENSIRAMLNSDDWLRFTLNHKLVEPPGERFNYAGGMTVLLGEIISRTSGRDLGDFAERNLFQPMGIHIEGWHRSRHGTVNAQGGLLLRPRDMAKIGQLMLDGGTWQGQRIVSEAWARGMVVPRIDADLGRGYGYQWWIGQAPIGDELIDLFFASGRGGQHIFVIPSLRLVAVFTAQPKDNPGGWRRNSMMLLDYVLPAVTGIMPPRPLRQGTEAIERYAGRYQHDETGHEVTVALEGDKLVVRPSFWHRILLDRIGPDSFSGYWDQLGTLRAQIMPGDRDEADSFSVRFLLGRRVYRRIQ